jgi:hypothetical protein
MIIPIKTPRVTNQGPKYILASVKLKQTDTNFLFHVMQGISISADIIYQLTNL